MEECTSGSSRKWITCSSHLFLLMWCLAIFFLLRLTLVSLVQNSTIESTTFFESTFILFGRFAFAHYMLEPTSSNYTILFCPLLKILRFTPISWPVAIRFGVEFDTTMLETTFLHPNSSTLWQPLIPNQPPLILSTISKVVSYCFEFIIRLSTTCFKVGFFRSVFMVNCWWSRPLLLVILCKKGAICFASLDVNFSMSPM